jgi:hypothetical protein
MMTDQSRQGEMPFMVILKLHEGYVLNVQGYGIAITNADDLAKRVGEVAAQSEAGFQSAQPAVAERDISDSVFAVPGPPPGAEPRPIDVVETAAALQPQADGVVPTASLESEWQNIRRMMAFMVAGFDTNGKAFTRKEWDAALPIFAPHVDPKEAEFALSEFLSEMDGDD